MYPQDIVKSEDFVTVPVYLGFVCAYCSEVIETAIKAKWECTTRCPHCGAYLEWNPKTLERL
jgi:predicted nucleic acid-binding Zn ribbon protein